MANAPSSDNLESDNKSLSTIFQEGLDLYNNLGKIDEPTNSPSVQANVKKAIQLFENATRLVSLAALFSTNESIDEVATEDLRFLLLPALLGALFLKITSRDRKDITEIAEIYYKDFLQRCNDYGLSNYKFNDEKPNDLSAEKTDMEVIKFAVNSRAGKIQRFREQKELKTKLEQLKVNMENENADDEIKRNYFLTMINLFIYEAIDELSSVISEKQILEHMSQMNREMQPKSKRPPPPPLKPVIITRDDVQKAVFGAGYPSLPVMSVQEFYDKRVQDGIFPNPDANNAGKPLCLQDATPEDISERDTRAEEENEKRLEEDDADHLKQMRQKDEFKDNHRRGWGNRMNRS